MKARWQVLVERILCLWVELIRLGELYDMLDTRFNSHVRWGLSPLILDTVAVDFVGNVTTRECSSP